MIHAYGWARPTGTPWHRATVLRLSAVLLACVPLDHLGSVGAPGRRVRRGDQVGKYATVAAVVKVGWLQWLPAAVPLPV